MSTYQQETDQRATFQPNVLQISLDFKINQLYELKGVYLDLMLPVLNKFMF